MNQHEYFGFGSIKNLKTILDEGNQRNIFLVSGGKSYKSSGAEQELSKILAPYTITRFYNFSPNPKLEDVEKGIDVFKREEQDLVIAVGGGSVIDMAKLINSLSAQPGNPEDYAIGKKIESMGNPLIAIPTTSGAGSEATHFAVVYIGKTKYSLGHQEWMLPRYVFLDPALTFDLPKYITASTGIDALCQAIESYWSTQSTGESKKYARQAIPLILANLTAAVNAPSPKNREVMLLGANLAGKAINISKTTACHSVSYPITSYFGVSHGHACALTLGEMCLFNSKVTENDCLDKRGAKYVQQNLSELCSLFQTQTPEQLQHKIHQLINQIGLNTKLTDLNITAPEHHDLIVANGFNPERVKNNPRELTEIALRNILKRIS